MTGLSRGGVTTRAPIAPGRGPRARLRPAPRDARTCARAAAGRGPPRRYRRAAAIGEHEVEVRYESPPAVVLVVRDTLERGRRIDVPEHGRPPRRPQRGNRVFQRGVEHANAAGLDHHIGRGGGLHGRARMVLRRGIDDDARPGRVRHVAIALTVQCVRLVESHPVPARVQRADEAARVKRDERARAAASLPPRAVVAARLPTMSSRRTGVRSSQQAAVDLPRWSRSRCQPASSPAGSGRVRRAGCG